MARAVQLMTKKATATPAISAVCEELMLPDGTMSSLLSHFVPTLCKPRVAEIRRVWRVGVARTPYPPYKKFTKDIDETRTICENKAML